MSSAVAVGERERERRSGSRRREKIGGEAMLMYVFGGLLIREKIKIDGGKIGRAHV